MGDVKTTRVVHTKKSSVPRHTDRPQMGAKSTRNFVKTNAVNNIMSVPRKPAPQYVDTALGSCYKLEHSGLVPKYIKKKVSNSHLSGK